MFAAASPDAQLESRKLLNALSIHNEADRSIQHLDLQQDPAERRNFETVDKDLKELINIKQNMLDEARRSNVFFKSVKQHVKLQRHHNKHRPARTID